MKNMTAPSVITEYMKKNDFFFKKNLGQNFLRDENVARKIVEELDLEGSETVLEIGPGFGALTQFLVNDAKEVIQEVIDQKEQELESVKNVEGIIEEIKQEEKEHFENVMQDLEQDSYQYASQAMRLQLEILKLKEIKMNL